ncbi:MAG: DUF3108 domain-containing protein [Bacteroidales bacterium]|jgi:hypothetical protein|nr:DUF3108 domain-containing protein [Bacteroidales bacterium]MBQ2197461.1 DUF3108 domain-containing protein [Bacteroidales bacterium]MBQ2531969.1 DUF3108 domain-containing protein [Bacteroidales bacterium]MBQ5410313.1 DUF3108 domain-containing protein [Bacteroidales bacterium]MBR5397544.1 DUF3108 domain-containing protein [Bacteroidales bacterium]
MNLKHLPGLVALMLLLSAAAVPVYGQKCIPVNLNKDKLAFKGGEKLVFTIHYKWGIVNADVAQAIIKLDSTRLNGKKVYHGSLSGNTQKIYEQVFKVREHMDSWFTCDGFDPVKFTRDAREGNYWCTNLYTYSGSQINATINNSRKGEFNVTLPKDNCTFDLPLMYYVMRNMDVSKLKVGGRYPMTFACDSHVRTLSFVYLGKENRKVRGMGTVRCLKFGFDVVKGEVFSGDSKLYAWFTDDANKIPVYFVAPLKLGEVRGRLYSSSGVRHPFTSIESD